MLIFVNFYLEDHLSVAEQTYSSKLDLSTEEERNGATETTHVDGTSRRTVCSGRTGAAGGRDFLRHRSKLGREIFAQDISAGGFGPPEGRAGQSGWRHGGQRGEPQDQSASGGPHAQY